MVASSRLVCSDCHVASARNMRFCGQCGVSLKNAFKDSGQKVKRAAIGERRLLTVLFCDLVGSTRLASTLEAEDLRYVLMIFREACASAIQHFGGTVGQYLGDGILAYFGYPRAREDDAQRALRAADQARRAMAAVTSRLATRGLHLTSPIALRIGVHSGLLIVADLGKGRNAEAAAIVGQTTNIAARLQAAAATGSILVSEATARLSGSRFELTDLGLRELSGITLPLRTFEVGAERHESHLHSTSSRIGQAPFLGRQTEMAALRASWSAVSLGAGVLVVITAEAGLGKSRLVSEFRGELETAGEAAVMLACSIDDRSSPYYPILSWIRRELDYRNCAEPGALRNALHQALGQQGEARHELYLAALLDCATPEEQIEIVQAPRRRRRQTEDSLLEFLRIRLGQHGPNLIVIEDMQWADDSTLGFVKTLAYQCLTKPQTMLLLTSRTCLAICSEIITTSLTLPRLPENDASQLVRALVPANMSNDVIERIVKRTDGIPLFTEEVARMASTLGKAWADCEQIGGENIPLTLHGTFMAQLDGLGVAKSVAQVAAVIGRSFEITVLEAVMEDTETSLIKLALTRLVDARFLDFQGRESEASTYSFRHTLVRDTAYNSILTKRRQALHGLIGKVLRDIFPSVAQSRPDILAQHFALAGLQLEAAEFYYVAARQLAFSLTHAEAAVHCRSGLAQLSSITANLKANHEIRLQILLASQITAIRGNADPAVRKAFENARDVAETAGDHDWLRRALRGLHTFYLVKGDVGAGFRISQRVIELAGNEVEAGQRIQLHRPHGLTLLYMGRFEEARRELVIAISLYEPNAHGEHRFEFGSDPLVLARCHLSWVEWFIGDAECAFKECQSAVSIARSLEHPHSLAFALAFQACLSEFMDRAETAKACAEELVQLSDYHEYAYWSAWGRIVLGWSKSVLGEPGEGEELLCRGLTDYEATGAGLLVPYANMLLSRLVSSRDRCLGKHLDEMARKKATAGAMGIWIALRKLRGQQDMQRNVYCGSRIGNQQFTTTQD